MDFFSKPDFASYRKKRSEPGQFFLISLHPAIGVNATHNLDSLHQLFFGLSQVALPLEELGIEGIIPRQNPGHLVLLIRSAACILKTT